MLRNLSKVREAINDKQTKTLFANQRRNFPRVRIIANEKNELWQADLMDTGSLNPEDNLTSDTKGPFSKTNQPVKFLLIVIDVYSRYAWAIPLPSKDKTVVTPAFEYIVREAGAPQKLHVDDGGEFWNAPLKKQMLHHDVNMYSTHSDVGAPHAERFIRTIRGYIAKVRQHTHSTKWVHVLPEILHIYNTRVHSVTQETPEDVFKNEKVPMEPDEVEVPDNEVPILIGTPVRIAKQRGIFDKSVDYIWSRQVYMVVSIVQTSPTTYLVADHKGEVLQGVFYRQELQETVFPDKYDVRVLGSQINKQGKKEIQVEWIDYDDEPQWIPASDAD